MPRVRLFVSALSFGVVVASAATPVARVIGAESLQVDGISVPARNYVPVELGGEVTTGTTSAVIQFVDGASAVVQPNSQVKIVGDAGDPKISVLRGAAQYRLATTPDVATRSVTKTSAKKKSDAAVFPPSLDVLAAVSRTGTSPATLIPAGPAAPIAVSGGFTSGPIYSGTFISNAGSGGTGLSILLPSGLTINLAPKTDPNTGVVSYTIASITQEVTQPNGVSVPVQVTTGNLIGATVPAITPQTVSGSTVAVQIIPVGSNTPLTPTQASQAVTTSVTTAVNTAVSNGTLQAGTTPPAPTPVSTGTFSGQSS